MAAESVSRPAARRLFTDVFDQETPALVWQRMQAKKKKPHTHAFPTPLALVSHVADHISPIDYLYFSIT